MQAVRFIIVQFSPRSVYLPFRSKYPPQHSVLRILSLCSSLKVRDPVSLPYSTTGKITILYILILGFICETGRQKIWTEG
jgi:hypothetical protein